MMMRTMELTAINKYKQRWGIPVKFVKVTFSSLVQICILTSEPGILCLRNSYYRKSENQIPYKFIISKSSVSKWCISFYST